MNEFLLLTGLIFLFIGIVLIILSAFITSEKKNVKFAFGGFIGPIPFGFSNEENLLKIIILISVIFFTLFLIFNFLLK